MTHSNITNLVADLDHLGELVAKKLMVDASSVITFDDSNNIITDLLKMYSKPSVSLISAGHATAEMAIAADRADMSVKEILGKSPFKAVINEVIEAVVNSSDIIVVANPNRITGITFSLSELEQMASAVPDGLLLVDEYYFDHLGISALPLIADNPKVVVMRSFTSSFGLSSMDAGYLVSNTSTIQSIRAQANISRLSPIVRKTILATLLNDDALSHRLAEIHEDSLRLSLELNRLGIQSRITATDYLLMRVKDAKAVGNHLARYKIRLEDLNGYPGLKNYVRYKLQSYFSNSRLIEAFEKMPVEFYKMRVTDFSLTQLRRGPEVKETKTGGTDIPSRLSKKTGFSKIADGKRDSDAFTRKTVEGAN